MVIRRKIFELLDPSEGGTRWDRAINTFIIILIILNVLAVILETVDSLFENYSKLFIAFEKFSIVIFSIEYILRLWTIDYKKEYHHPFYGRIKYFFSASALIDLIAILPAYLPLLFGVELRFVRAFRIFRFIRFFKVSRYMNARKTISRVFQSKKEELLLSLGITFFLIIMAACVMYFVEHDAQPEKFSSIPETMWWSVATLTTVGYGDVYPITGLGKTLTALISVLGIGMFALPAGILASGFSDEFKREKHKQICPHCKNEF